MRTEQIGMFGLCLLLLVALGACARSTPLPGKTSAFAKKGRLDLRQWDAKRDGVLRLRGDWAVYWRQLLSPDKARAAQPTGFLEVPGLWNGGVLGAHKLSSKGYATYRLQLHLAHPQMLALRINRIYTSYRFYIDGALRASRGKVRNTPSQERFELNPQLITFHAGKEVEFVLQVSNYAHRKGGPADAIRLGSNRQIMRDRALHIAFDLFSFSILFIIGLYYLTLHLMMRRSVATLYFALLCFCSAVRTLLVNEQFLFYLVPSLPYPMLLRLEYLMLYALCATTMMFMQATFPKEFPTTVLRGFQLYWGVLAILALVAAPSVYTFSWWFFFASVPFATAYFWYVNVRAIQARREGAWLLLVGMLFAIALGIHDVIQYGTRGEIELELMPMGFLVLFFCQALLLARRFSKAFAMTEKLSLELEEKNVVLTQLNAASSRFVPFEFLALLGKENLTEVSLGDQIQKEMSVLFSDIRSFMTISEGMTPEENFAFINDYLKHMEPVVRRHHGFIDKYIGDAVMALFDKRVDDSVKAAIGMVRALNTFNEEQVRKGRVSIRIGIGLNTGLLMLGTIGGEERMDGTVISDAVNLAARIEGMTKHYGASILISEFTYRALEHPELYQVRVIDKVLVKGKLAPVTVYEVFDGEPDHLRTQKVRTSPAFVKAFEAYTEGAFADALGQFEALQADFPEDKATALYTKRCEMLLAAPPENWNGVFELASK